MYSDIYYLIVVDNCHIVPTCPTSICLAFKINLQEPLLVKDFRESFGSGHDEAAELLGALALSAIECIGKSDCLYHNFEHTRPVTLVGREILRGRMLLGAG